MERIFTRKPDVLEQLKPCLSAYEKGGLENCLPLVNKNILQQKIKFPLLEFCAREFITNLSAGDLIPFCDLIEHYKTIGGHVLLGIILQSKLDEDFEMAFAKAKKYISLTDSWHACDSIGERVFGVGLLTNFKKAYPEITLIAQHESQWVVRSMGAGMHYAIKKGLDKQYIPQLFELLLSMGNVKNKEIKQGVGWAAKTSAKFHPRIINKYKAQIADEKKVGAWFRTKVRIGLSRNEYAKRN